MSLVLLFVQRTRTKFVDDHTHGPKCVFLSEEMNDNVLDYIISKVMILYVDPNKLVKMRTTQVLQLALALLMVASGVVTEASMDGIAKFNYRCVATLIPSRKPCNNDTCDMACFDLIKVPKQGKCDVVGCKCMICEDQSPLQRING